jgi:general secretion pathway protein D
MRKIDFRTSVAMTALLLASACAMLRDSDRKPGPDNAAAGTVKFGPVIAPPSVQQQTPPAQAATGPAPAARAAEPPRGEGDRIFPGTGVLVKQTPALPPALPGPEDVVLNFEGVDIRTVVETIFSTYLREPYLVHPAVAGTITLRTTRGIPRQDLIPTLELLLRQNGAALVHEDGLYKVLPLALVKGSVTPQLGGSTIPIPSGFSVLVVPLKYIGAKPMVQILEPFAIEGGSTVRPDEVRNLVIMAGGQRELKHLLETIDLFDVDFLSGMSVGLFYLKSTDAKSLVADMDKIFGTAGNPLAGIVRVLPIERLNALLIVTPQPRYLEEARKWIERLDQSGDGSGGAKLHVYQVKNGKAENLAALLSEVFGGKSASSSSAPQLAPGARPTELRSPPYPSMTPSTSQNPAVVQQIGPSSFVGDGTVVSKDVRVIADKDNNALLILASAADYDTIEAAIRKLDIVPRQVLVEITIAEVTLTDALQYGIDWFIRTRNNTAGTLNVNGSLPPRSGGFVPSNPVSALDFSSFVTQGIVPAPAKGGLQLLNIAGGELRAVLNSLGSDGKVKLVASPQVTVADNQTAQIKVGSRISVQTGSQTTGTTSGTIVSNQYLDTGVLIEVKPRVNTGGQVTLEINTEFSVPDLTSVTSANPNPTINSRSAKTFVTVGSGETMALAGLIRQDRSTGSSGVPLLSKIPIIGGIFGQQSFSDIRTELVIMITPKVITNAREAQDVTDELRRKLPALEDMLPKRKVDSETRKAN